MSDDEVPQGGMPLANVSMLILELVADIGSILGEDLAVEDIPPPAPEPELLPFADRPFDRATYQLFSHALTLRADEDMLLREPTEHLSADASTVERWWDTTNSFHFSSAGEMTITPYDFSMLIGLRVGVGDSILFDPNMIQWKAA
ncbi:hypothetical protein ACSBR1_033814 [Camellia fascicularis]